MHLRALAFKNSTNLSLSFQAEEEAIARAKNQPPSTLHTWSVRDGHKFIFRNLNTTTGITEATVVKRITSQMHFWDKECHAFPMIKKK